MRIRRIEVPSFRVLRDVEMDFDAGFEQQIFPIGSENGGGKSTLLQLVFGLLHCAGHEKRRPYLSNLLANGLAVGGADEQLLARVSVERDGVAIDLRFVVLRFEALADGFGGERPALGFAALDSVGPLKAELGKLERHARRTRELDERLADMPPGEHVDAVLTPRTYRLFEGHEALRSVERNSRVSTVRRQLSVEKATVEAQIADAQGALALADKWAARIRHLLTARGEVLVTAHRPPHLADADTVALVCRAEGLGTDETAAALLHAAERIFLLGPSNQQYLFLPRASRKALVSASSLDYLGELNTAEEALPGFFAYDWLSVGPLVKLFAEARDRDFEEVVRTGEYGSHYTTMLADVNALLTGKTARPLPDLEGIEFTATRPDGAEITLGPEDLSRGELKRLMIYAWLKANRATDAVVLIDEIEASFHPDWQYRIIRDLQEWAPGNQYLLATHSFDLCEALTPAHVRALEPRLGARGAAADDA